MHELIRTRWSPSDFSSRPVEPEKLRSLFEAARWAASCFNEQPWRFIIANTGAAMANLAIEGTALVVRTQFMGGFDASAPGANSTFRTISRSARRLPLGISMRRRPNPESERALDWKRSSS